jgi:hypothetical protein
MKLFNQLLNLKATLFVICLLTTNTFLFSIDPIEITPITSTVTGCGGNVQFTLKLKNPSTNAVPFTGVSSTINFSPGVEFINVDPAGTTPGVTSTGTPGNVTFHCPNIAPGVEVIIVYNVKAGCNSIVVNNANNVVSPLTDQILVNYNNGSAQVLNTTQTYSIVAPVLLYIPASNVNIPYNNANIGDVFYRSVTIQNTGNVPFNGVISITDLFGSSAEIQNISITGTTGVGISSLNFSNVGNTATFSATISGLQGLNNGSITITEQVKLINCLEGGLANSHLNFAWGCDLSDLCQLNTFNNGSGEDAPVVPIVGGPVITVPHPPTLQYTCTGTTQHLEYVFKNTGTATAKNLHLILHSNFIGDFNSIIDRNSVMVTAPAGILMTAGPGGLMTNSFPQLCSTPGPGFDPLDSISYHFDLLPAGDSIVISFDYLKCCPSEPGFFNLETQGSIFNWWGGTMLYQNACGNSFNTGFNTGGSAVKMTQQDITYFNNMAENNTATFKVANKSLIISADLYNNFCDAQLKVKLKMDKGFHYVPGTMFMVASGGTSTWYPLSVTPTTDTTCADNEVIATFAFCPQFNNYNELATFIIESTLQFDLHTCCLSEQPLAYYTEETYFVPDTTCPTNCEMAIASISKGIAIHCPGCVTPGIIGQGYSVVRETLGLIDNDANGLPDSNNPPDLSLINRQRAIVGDIITCTWQSHFQDGDNNGGIIYADLVTQNGFELDHCYLNTTISHANRLMPLDAEVTLIRIDCSVSPCTTITMGPFILPASAITAYNSDANVLFDASLNILQGAGLDPLYKFLPGDQIAIKARYKLYGNIEFPSIQLIDINNKMYLTGTAETPTSIGAIQEAGAINSSLGTTALAPQHGYVCEGFGAILAQVAYSADAGGSESVGYYAFDALNNDYCNKQIVVKTTGIMGNWPINNLFPFEYRPVVHAKSYQFAPPPGYTLNNVTRSTLLYRFTNGITDPNQFCLTSMSNVLPDVGVPNTYNVLPYTITNFTNGYDPSCPNLYPATFPDIPLGNSIGVSAFTFDFTPICDVVADVTPLNPITVEFENQPTTPSNFTHVKDPFFVVPFTFVKPTLVLTCNVPEQQVTTSQVCWDVTLLNQINPLFVGANIPNPLPTAGHVFFIINPGSTHLSNVTVMLNGVPILPNLQQVYELPNLPYGEHLDFTICADYACTQNIERLDHLEVIYGWNCGGYPVDPNANDACYKNTLNLPMKEVAMSFAASYTQQPAVINNCSSNLHYQVVLSTTNTGIPSNATVQLTLPPGLSFVNGSDFFTPAATPTSPQPTVVGNTVTWSLDAYNITLNNTIHLDFDLLNDGSYAGSPILTNISGQTFCGNTVDFNFSTTSATITNNTVTIQSNTNPCGNNPTILTAYPGSPGTYTYLWSNGDPNQSISVNSSGTYSVIVTDVNGCTTTGTTNITQTVELNITGFSTNINCFNDNNGTIGLTVIGGTPGYTYQWSNGSFSPSLSGLAAGNYSVTVTDANGCTITYSNTITQPPELIVTATSTNTCTGGSTGSINTTVTGGIAGYGYSWNAGIYTTPNLTNLPAGTYTVLVTDGNNCTATASAVVSSNPAIALNITTSNGTGHACAGSPFSLTATSGNTSYQWYENSNPGIILGTTEVYSPTSSGNYCVQSVDPNGCTTQPACMNVVIYPLPTVTISGNTIVCSGSSTTLTANPGSPGTYTYLWSTTAPTQSITVNSAGTYSVTATDVNGCSGTASVTVTTGSSSPINITTSNGTNHACAGSGYSLSATNSYTGYHWYLFSNPGSPLGTNQTFSPTTSGNYCVQAIGTNGCATQIACMNITIYPLPTPVADTPTITRCHTSPSFHLSQHAGINVLTPYFTPHVSHGHLSSTSPGFSTTSGPGTIYDVFTPSSATIGPNIIYYTVTTNNGCASSTSMTINVINEPTINFPPIPPIDLCTYNGVPVHITASSSGGVSVLSGPGINSVNQTFDPIAAGGAGTYAITYACTSACGIAHPIQMVTVTENDSWNQTTTNSNGGDIYNDVATDAHGNVYVVGTFKNQTTLKGGSNPPITIQANSIVPGLEATFVAKYDNCANLIWVAHSSLSSANTGKSIILDEGRNVLYITGDYSNSLKLTGSNLCPTGITLTTGISDAAYVAQYQMNTGCLFFVGDASVSAIKTDPEAITIDKNSHRIYVGGKQGLPGVPNPTFSAYVVAYHPTFTPGGSLGALTWVANTTSLSSVVNDLDYDDIPPGGLWGIGTFEKNINFPGPSGTMLSRSTSPAGTGGTDAFVFFYQSPGSGNIPNLLKQGNIPVNSSGGPIGIMTGEGIAVNDADGNLCLTGTYNLQTIKPFELGGWNVPSLVTLPPNTTTPNAYMIYADQSGINSWKRMVEPGTGTANGYGVVINNTTAYFTGNYTGNNALIGGQPLPSYVYANGPGFRTYVAAYPLASGPGSWANVTTTPTTGSHTPNAIATDHGNNLFVVGSYTGELGYLNVANSGIPASGNLVSSFGPNSNGFILREYLSNGDFKIDHVEDPEITENEVSKFSFSVKAVPNPTSGIVEIWVEGLPDEVNAKIEIFSLTGTSVYAGTLTSKRYTLDISSLAAGTYLLRITYNQYPVTVRVIKI